MCSVWQWHYKVYCLSKFRASKKNQASIRLLSHVNTLRVHNSKSTMRTAKGWSSLPMNSSFSCLLPCWVNVVFPLQEKAELCQSRASPGRRRLGRGRQRGGGAGGRWGGGRAEAGRGGYGDWTEEKVAKTLCQPGENPRQVVTTADHQYCVTIANVYFLNCIAYSIFKLVNLVIHFCVFFFYHLWVWRRISPGQKGAWAITEMGLRCLLNWFCKKSLTLSRERYVCDISD